MKSKALFVIIAMLLVVCSQAMAQDSTGKAMQGMPPMGPPEEMKQVAYLVGTWDFNMKMKMTMTDTGWTESKGTLKYESAFGGSTILGTYESTMPDNMPFIAGQMISYDRAKKEWQEAWVDNMGARIVVYTGTRSANGMTFQGEDIDMMTGQPVLGKMVISNETPTSFDWKGDISSDGGKTWLTWGTAKYTKRP